MAIKSKNGFVFSVFALFVAFLLFGYAASQFEVNTFEREKIFVEARVTSINNELLYFKEVYLPQTLSFSFYNTMDALLDYSHSNYTLSNNHSALNRLVQEGMMNASFYNSNQSSLENKTISHFIEVYQSSFNDTHLSNITILIDKMNVYEKTPYTLTLQINASYHITTQDNISTWDLTDYIEVDVPMFDLVDPQFLFKVNQNYTLRPANLFTASVDWTSESLNETIFNTYSSVYLSPAYRYTLGESFINRLLNISPKQYAHVEGFWSFDYDQEENALYDTSQNSPKAFHYGNTFLLVNFDNSSLNASSLLELSGYRNTATVSGTVQESQACVLRECMVFDGSNDELLFDQSLNFSTRNLTLSFWINTSNSVDESIIMSQGFTSDAGLELGMNNALGNPGAPWLGLSDGITSETCYFDFNLSQGTFMYVSVLIDRSDQNTSLFVNGAYIESCGFSFNQSDSFSSAEQLSISSSTSSFDGTLDELNIFGKALTLNEIISIYTGGEATLIDYTQERFDKALIFDGEDDYASIPQTFFSSGQDTFAIELWARPGSNNSNAALFSLEDVGIDVATVSITNSNISFQFTDSSSTQTLTGIGSFTLDEDVYLLAQSDGSTAELYINGVLVDSVGFNDPLQSSSENITLGARQSTSFYKGTLDEVKIYNRSLTQEEIEQHYHNYAGSAKGCCNYITLINPNRMGFNSTTYNQTLSYGSTSFFDFYLDGIYGNVTLYNLTNFTSLDENDLYYNFRFDLCMLQAFNVFDFDIDPGPQIFKAVNDTNTCEDLIALDLY